MKDLVPREVPPKSDYTGLTSPDRGLQDERVIGVVGQRQSREGRRGRISYLFSTTPNSFLVPDLGSSDRPQDRRYEVSGPSELKQWTTTLSTGGTSHQFVESLERGPRNSVSDRIPSPSPYRYWSVESGRSELKRTPFPPLLRLPTQGVKDRKEKT